MKIGTICYATTRGLGYLAKNFIDNGVINDICVVNHPSVPMQDWYPKAPVVQMREMNTRVTKEFCDGHEAMLFFETPFDWSVIPHCKMRGIRTYLVTMYECSPQPFPVEPHRYLCPSLLDYDEFPAFSKLVSIPCEVPWRLRTQAKIFVHNGGYLGLRGREGTELLIEAMQFVQAPIELIIRVQENVSPSHIRACNMDKRISYRPERVPFDQLYAEGDVYVAPQKFNGMSMPLLEARASGMALLTTDRYPTNSWLGTDGVYIPVHHREQVRLAARFRPIEFCNISPRDIAASIDSMAFTDIGRMSVLGKEWANKNSWAALKPTWMEVLSK